MRTCVIVAILGVSPAAFGQEFFLPQPALVQRAQSVERGEHRCFGFTVLTASVVNFLVSSTRDACVPVDATVTIYSANEEDPTSFLATGKREGRRCAEAERRLGAGTYKVCVAGTFGAAIPSFNVRKTARPSPRTPPNDTCSTPSVLGERGRLSASLFGGSNDHSPAPVGLCADASQSFGPEVVYAVDIGPGETLNARVHARGGEPSLYVLSECDRWWLACVGAGESRTPAQTQLRFRNRGPAARYFLVVDGKHREAFDFDLTWEVR